MVCAIRRSRSFVHFIAHLSPGAFQQKARDQSSGAFVRHPDLEGRRRRQRSFFMVSTNCQAPGGMVMSALKIAALLGVAVVFGVMVSVMLGRLEGRTTCLIQHFSA